MTVTGAWSRDKSAFSVLVHGGAGDVPDERVARHVDGCRNAARRAAERLASGGSALDAAELAVRVLEDDPVFNAGTGACLTADGEIELDACIMEGVSLRAGAVCALPPFQNPIAIARAVLEEGTHVLYAANGAGAFARAHGFLPVSQAALETEAAREKLAVALAAGKVLSWAGGTVGAVVRDRNGSVVAATSTGGTVGKKQGRVGDSPIVGAGTFADENGAASATGHGEGILRITLTRELVRRLATGEEPESAARAMIEDLTRRIGSTAGVISVSKDGALALARSTRTMTWAAEWDGGAEAGA
jgi:L-asparaginase / beta-aspartyl-peptidase